ncbi:MAG TPA: ubiquinol-cytochrome c reductase iron-sulfur subunit [Anaerolineales bacterium]|nr:ubiquinol-cytochrome c reductase iron-sulfur subunit [Anaerolineales bacterium]
MSNEQQVSRRDFLGIATWSIGGLISAIMAVPAVAYLLGPALTRTDAQNWIRLGSTNKVELGVPTLFKAKIERKTGWIVSQEEIAAFVLTEDGRDFIAMSNICTHLGCRVRWIADRQQFLSPCHNGIFDKLGNVVSGPPPRPLDRFQVKIENAQLLILGG